VAKLLTVNYKNSNVNSAKWCVGCVRLSQIRSDLGDPFPHHRKESSVIRNIRPKEQHNRLGEGVGSWRCKTQSKKLNTSSLRFREPEESKKREEPQDKDRKKSKEKEN